MSVLLSALAAVLTLVGLPGALGQPAHGGGAATQERAALARQRLALHQKAMACGDPSRSPYHCFRGPAGQSGSRHGEQQWYRELITGR